MDSGPGPGPGGRGVDPNTTSDDDGTPSSNSIPSGGNNNNNNNNNNNGRVTLTLTESPLDSVSAADSSVLATHDGGPDSKAEKNHLTNSVADDDDNHQQGVSTQPDTVAPERNGDDGDDADSSSSSSVFHVQNNFAVTNPMLKSAGKMKVNSTTTQS